MSGGPAAGRVAVAVAALALVACGGYAAPRPDQPSAELTIRSNRSDNPYGKQGAINDFTAFSAPHCPREANLGQLAKFSVLDDAPVALRIAADAPLYIRAHAFGSDGKGLTLTRNHCMNVVRFTPEAGHRYSLSQATRALFLERGQPLNIPGVGGLVCSVRLVDETTGGPPKDYAEQPAEVRCRP